MKKLLFVLFAAMPLWQVVHAQSTASAPISLQAATERHRAGLAMEHRGDERGAFLAFHDAAENGYPPAQRKLGEIFESGSAAVERDFAESIRWYQKAREGGEDIPLPKSPMPTMGSRP